ncbi:MAG: hypothetical protein HY365_03135 [Candidatus Aenigmarchaeota archaeon]|nr:hypothetical protein [Candidatus Aenigmarchaeota archaeon]
MTNALVTGKDYSITNLPKLWREIAEIFDGEKRLAILDFPEGGSLVNPDPVIPFGIYPGMPRPQPREPARPAPPGGGQPGGGGGGPGGQMGGHLTVDDIDGHLTADPLTGRLQVDPVTGLLRIAPVTGDIDVNVHVQMDDVTGQVRLVYDGTDIPFTYAGNPIPLAGPRGGIKLKVPEMPSMGDFAKDAMDNLKLIVGYLTERHLLSLDDARDQYEHLANRVVDTLQGRLQNDGQNDGVPEAIYKAFGDSYGIFDFTAYKLGKTAGNAELFEKYAKATVDYHKAKHQGDDTAALGRTRESYATKLADNPDRNVRDSLMELVRLEKALFGSY